MSQEEYHTPQEIYGISIDKQSEMTYEIDSNQHMMPDEEAQGKNKHEDGAMEPMLDEDESYMTSLDDCDSDLAQQGATEVVLDRNIIFSEKDFPIVKYSDENDSKDAAWNNNGEDDSYKNLQEQERIILLLLEIKKDSFNEYDNEADEKHQPLQESIYSMRNEKHGFSTDSPPLEDALIVIIY